MRNPPPFSSPVIDAPTITRINQLDKDFCLMLAREVLLKSGQPLTGCVLPSEPAQACPRTLLILGALLALCCFVI